MIKHEELSDPESCLNLARDDEPIFVLRANDVLAPSIVHYWADAYERLHQSSPAGITGERAEKLNEARKLAQVMEVWKRCNS